MGINWLFFAKTHISQVFLQFLTYFPLRIPEVHYGVTPRTDYTIDHIQCTACCDSDWGGRAADLVSHNLLASHVFILAILAGRLQGFICLAMDKGIIQVSVSSGGVVGWCEGAVYLRSPGRPTDIGLQLGKACYPCSG